MSLNLPKDELCVFDYFDFYTKGSSGRDLLLSCYSVDTSTVYFERRPLRPTDGTPAVVWKSHDGPFLLKAEVSEQGSSGRFQMYIWHSNVTGAVGTLSPRVYFNAFYGTHASFAASLGPVTYTIGAAETDREGRSARYSLFNRTSGETIFSDLVPSEDSTQLEVHAFSLSTASAVQLVVAKSYWGDFGNEIQFYLEE